MKKTIFTCSGLTLIGISVPDFELTEGSLVRICLPNFDSASNSLVDKFRFQLLEYFEKSISNVKYTKKYSESVFRRSLRPIMVQDYIERESMVDCIKAKNMADYLKLASKDNVKDLSLVKQKALAIKCNFQKYDTLVFDYYGVGAIDIDYLESIVNDEIMKGKSGIVVDRLEYNSEVEINPNIIQVKVNGKKRNLN